MSQDINLTTLDQQELEDLKKRVDQAIANLQERRKNEALEEARELAKKRGFSLEELMGKGSVKKKPRAEPKYRNPEDATQTWSGLGRKPKWILEKIEKGEDIEAFKI
eukprot:GHVR01186315.1.p2 GENE.GHVR01186315.1~~GHVR01186315.1.p2  ORF type:complete len:107 (-),score=15.92 GHVR01186315.1:57-377(-)